MAIIDTLRFRNILVNGGIADEAPAQELVTALDEAFEEAVDGLATKQDINQLRREMRGEMRANQAEIKQAIAEAVADLQRQILYATSLVLLAIGGAATLLAVFG